MKDKPVLIVIAGPNGSGKTTITQQLRRHTWMKDCAYVNPDQIAQDAFGDWNSTAASLKAANQAQQIRDRCLAQRESLAFETVFSAEDKLQFVLSALEAGYFIRLFFVCTEGPAINATRIIRRGLQGGHGVPTDKIISRFSKSIVQCAAAVEWVDRAYIYDNSVDEAPPSLLFRTVKGRLARQYGPIRNWAEPIFRRLHRAAAKVR